MAVKWICSSCGTVNIGEEAPVMECFVCGHVRDSEKLFRAGSEIVPVTAGEEDPSLPAPAERELPAAAPSGFGASLRSLGERLLAWWKGFFGKAGALPGRPSDEGTGGGAPELWPEDAAAFRLNEEVLAAKRVTFLGTTTMNGAKGYQFQVGSNKLFLNLAKCRMMNFIVSK